MNSHKCKICKEEATDVIFYEDESKSVFLCENCADAAELGIEINVMNDIDRWVIEDVEAEAGGTN